MSARATATGRVLEEIPDSLVTAAGPRAAESPDAR